MNYIFRGNFFTTCDTCHVEVVTVGKLDAKRGYYWKEGDFRLIEVFLMKECFIAYIFRTGKYSISSPLIREDLGH